MNDEARKKAAERYEQELGKGERFWPDSIYKDVLVSLGIFILVVLLATFIGVEAQPKADPSDTSYLPRPEWYFLFPVQVPGDLRADSGAWQDRMDRYYRHPRRGRR